MSKLFGTRGSSKKTENKADDTLTAHERSNQVLKRKKNVGAVLSLLIDQS